MFNSLLQDLRAPRPFATFNGSSSYRLEADQAHLMAEVQIAPEVPPASEWALQLWACDGQAHGGPVKLAEMPIAAVTQQAFTVDGWATLLPPASLAEHAMALTLARGQGGVFNELHDLVSFPRTERFVQPCFNGDCQAHWGEAELKLISPVICNPRTADNLSGTLAIELWALDAPYAGGAFAGVQLSALTRDALIGQGTAAAVDLSVPRRQIAADTTLVLMLREWTSVGYITRDFRHVVQVPDVHVPLTPTAAPALVAPPATATTAPAAPAAAGVKKPLTRRTPKAAAKTTAKPASTGVSINKASEDALAAIKGLSRPTAAGIIAARPYATLDDVLRAKGMGEKLLAKLHDQLSL